MLSKPQKIYLKDSETYIYKFESIKYDKDMFLKRIYQNRELYNNPEDNTLPILFSCDEFDQITNIAKNNICNEEEIEYTTVSIFSWVYFQKKDFKMQWMHNHLALHLNDLSKITSDWTYVFYVQIPKKIEGEEGNLVFEDKNKEKNNIVPMEGMMVIFPAHLPHIPLPTPNCEVERVVYCGNMGFNVHEKKNRLKSLV